MVIVKISSNLTQINYPNKPLTVVVQLRWSFVRPEDGGSNCS
jgi:hypothetical protein